MTKEVEDIIKNKAFSELTADERKRVGDLANNEEEYMQLQWFLTTTGASFEAQKISASPTLRNRVMEHLSESGNKKGFWLNSVGVFMLPKGKPLYQKPMVQLGVAATLVVGFLFFFNQPFKDQSLALNETSDTVVEPVDNYKDNRDGMLREQPVDEMPAGTVNEEENANFKREEDQVQQEKITEPAPFQNGRLGEGIVSADEMMEDAEVAEPALALKDTETDNYFFTTTQSAPESKFTKDLNTIVTADEEAETRDDRAKKNRQTTTAFSNKSIDLSATNKEQTAENVEVTVATGAITSPGVPVVALEEIIPKALHIDKTKELNQLFFIVK